MTDQYSGLFVEDWQDWVHYTFVLNVEYNRPVSGCSDALRYRSR